MIQINLFTKYKETHRFMKGTYGQQGERQGEGQVECLGLTCTHHYAAAAAAKSLQSCPTLCYPIDGSPPGSPVPGILQAQNTGVGCHFLLQCMKVKSESEVRSVVSKSQRPHGLQLPRLLRLWDFLGKSTGVGCRCLFHTPPYLK